MHFHIVHILFMYYSQGICFTILTMKRKNSFLSNEQIQQKGFGMWFFPQRIFLEKGMKKISIKY